MNTQENARLAIYDGVTLIASQGYPTARAAADDMDRVYERIRAGEKLAQELSDGTTFIAISWRIKHRVD